MIFPAYSAGQRVKFSEPWTGAPREGIIRGRDVAYPATAFLVIYFGTDGQKSGTILHFQHIEPIDSVSAELEELFVNHLQLVGEPLPENFRQQEADQSSEKSLARAR